MGTLVFAGAGGALESDVRRAARDESNVEYLGRLTREGWEPGAAVKGCDAGIALG